MAIGAFGSFGGSWLQQRHLTKRERVKLATELAVADRNEFVATTARRGGGPVLPIAAYIA